MNLRTVALPLVVALGVGAGLWLHQAHAAKSVTAHQHRAQADVCPSQRAAGKPDKSGGECQADSDCRDAKQGKNGRCSPYTYGRMSPKNMCSYDSCATDADCDGKSGAHGTKGICTCDAARGNFCLPGNCHTDADCGSGSSCSPSYPLCSLHGPYRPDGYYCHQRTDECTNDDDCPQSTHKGYGPESTRCVYSAPLGHFTCESRECPVG